MGQKNTGINSKGKKEEPKRKEKEQVEVEVEVEEDEVEEEHDQDGLSVHSPCKPSSSAIKEESEVELELKLLESLEFYPPNKLQGVHRYFVLYGLTDFLRKSFNRPFTSDEVLKLLDRFYNLEMLKPDDEETEILNCEQEFSLPRSFFEHEDS